MALSRLLPLAAVMLGTAWAPALAQDIHIGATLSTTGPAASIGAPVKNTFQILPKEIAGVPVTWTILDDGTDTTQARRNAEKLADEGVDVIFGGSTTPTSLATVEVAGRTETPTVSLGPSPALVDPVDGPRRWVFKSPQGERELAGRTIRDMKDQGIGSFAYIGFNDALGDAWHKELEAAATEQGIKVTADERFARTDNSVTAQVLKAMSSRPDAMFLGASGTPAALPVLALRERGFTGPIYLTSGVVNNDFLRVAGKAADGVRVAGGPIVVADSLPDSDPSKAVSLQLKKLYEDAYGPGSLSLFAGNAYDGWLLVQHAATEALKTEKPGTPAFRSALRDALENTKDLAVTSGVMNMSPTNHGIYPMDAPLMLTVKDGKWSLLQ